ncbi:hypothetical protein Y032_0013g2187 [Ancylostoma ceylanicum]|uniref:Uncharacterized protein n=1 Tax=Ancylostoma ceylanicum TaxID=53326 RepID=A0A016VBX7_9BILA|nr:hypothetical protein Y032_0013g2187 [Ancylostoma ceylanicum]
MAMSPSHIPPSQVPPARSADKAVTILNPTVSSKEKAKERCSRCGRRYRQARKVSSPRSTKSIGDSLTVDASKSQK